MRVLSQFVRYLTRLPGRLLTRLPAPRLAQQERRRLGMGLLVMLVAVGVAQASRTFPRETQLEYSLGPSHDEIVEARVAYVRSDEEIHGVTFHYPKGAPLHVRHRLQLSPGEYQVTVHVVERSGERFVLEGRFRAPADGVTRVSLSKGLGS